ncbi:MAG: cyclic pyranopterin monophosphate synthase MoaC [Bacteroidales bacterium]|nr:cyclic pyranopterin monophosphate synthase MoaC [Bacteroidales bacterium]MDT8372408.1 cyclic pyranopterin monophosphate synthase MoaC [Bacteroidales bacterium]
MRELTHTDESGRAHMVDTGGKPVQHRTAVASGRINMQPETLRLVAENMMKKGDVITVAEIAGIQAAKQCGTLVPLCHNITLDQVKVTLEADDHGITAVSTVRCTGRTGVEMEALTAVSVALLTVYDMCKAVDKTMTITDIRLDKKEKHDIT